MRILSAIILAAVFLWGAQSSLAAAQKSVGDYLPREQTISSGQKYLYSGNVKTNKYHNPDCKFYHCRDCTKFFKTPAAARKAGFEACKVCGG